MTDDVKDLLINISELLEHILYHLCDPEDHEIDESKVPIRIQSNI